MEKIIQRLNEENIWKKLREQHPDNVNLVREIWDAAQKGRSALYAAHLLRLIHESERLGFHRGLLRGGVNKRG